MKGVLFYEAEERFPATWLNDPLDLVPPQFEVGASVLTWLVFLIGVGVVSWQVARTGDTTKECALRGSLAAVGMVLVGVGLAGAAAEDPHPARYVLEGEGTLSCFTPRAQVHEGVCDLGEDAEVVGGVGPGETVEAAIARVEAERIGLEIEEAKR